MSIIRKEGPNKIDVEIKFDKDKSLTFGIRGTTWRFSSTGFHDDIHRRISRIFHEYVERPTLKVSNAVKLNQVQNFAMLHLEFSAFIRDWSERNIYSVPLELLPVEDLKKAAEEAAKPPEKPVAKKKGKEARPPKAPKPVREPAKPGEVAAPFQPKYEYPADITSPEAKKKWRAKQRAEAKKVK